MAVYTTQFSEYTDDQLPSDWTMRWDTTAPDYYKRGETSAYDDAVLEFTAAGDVNREVLSWDDIDNEATVDIQTIMMSNDWGSVYAGIAARAYANNGYLAYFGGPLSRFNIAKITNSTLNGINYVAATTPTDGDWWHIRFQLSGSALKAKFWKDGTQEPIAWTVTSTDSTFSAGGWNGVYNGETALKFDFFSCGTNGSSPSDPNYTGPIDPEPNIEEPVSVDDVPTVRKIIFGSVCYGHVTDVEENNTETFIEQWAGTGAVSGSGDGESLMIGSSDNMISLPANVGDGTCTLEQNKYGDGATCTLYYRTAATYDACLTAGWTAYTVSFTSLGYVSVKAEI